MTKTAEEAYEERLADYTRTMVLDFFDGGVGYLEVSEFLSDEDYDYEEVRNDLYDRVNASLDTIAQRFADD